MSPYKSTYKRISMMLSLFVSLFAPPRPTESIIEGLTIDGLHKLARYDGTLPYHEQIVRALVWELKYRASPHAQRLSGEYLADLLLAEAEDSFGTLLLVPVPMHTARRKERGHNQTELLCEAALSVISGEMTSNVLSPVSSKSAIKKVLGSARSLNQTIFAGTFAYDPTLLQRVVNTKTQQRLERHARLHNVKNSMVVLRSEQVRGRVCIVVDDVTTTGATFAEAKRALKAAGASEVRCVALAQS